MKEFIKKYPFLAETARKFLSLQPANYRFGKKFRYWYALFHESEDWSLERHQDYQFHHLKEIVKKAQKDIPFYQQHLNEESVNKITDFDSFKKYVPVIDRQTYLKNITQLCRKEKYNGKLTVSSSSGTTGTPLTFYHDKEDDSREWAALCYQWNQVGYDPWKSKRAEFRGIVSGNRLVDHFPDKNMLRVNIFRINKETVSHYADEIKKNKIDFFHGFPSAIALLADIIQQYSIKFPQPKGILLASEQIHDFQLEKIKSAFPDSKLTAHYGCAERTVMAGWCAQNHVYHVVPHYGYVETDPATNEIIATNLYNTINPFIRYKMSDTVVNQSNQPCSHCGRSFTPLFEQIAGRMEDYLYSEENGWIAPAAVTYPLKTLTSITEMQFIQKEKRKLIFKFKSSVPDKTAELETELDEVVTGLKKMLGQSMTIKTEQVENIERSNSGKFCWIINELDETPMKQE